MEILINPNVAYLILMIGVVLAIMALFAPGTGVLEIGALFMLFLAGWEISQQPINFWALLLLILGVVPFIIAVRRSRKLIYLVVALVAFIIGSAYAMGEAVKLIKKRMKVREINKASEAMGEYRTIDVMDTAAFVEYRRRIRHLLTSTVPADA